MTTRALAVLFVLALGCTSAAPPEPEAREQTKDDATELQPAEPTPEPIEAIELEPGQAATDIIALAQSKYPSFACALRRAGRVACWGANDWGQLGQGHYDSVEGVVEVRDLVDAIDLEIASGTACAIRRKGEVVCWGSNQRGELGTGNQLAHAGLVTVDLVTDAERLFASSDRMCATTPTQAWCWGSGHGPMPLSQGNVVALMLGERRSLARLRDDSLTTLDADAEPIMPWVIDAFVDGKAECLVSVEGALCTLNSWSEPWSIAAMRGVSAIAFGPESDDVTGLFSDGTLKVASRKGGERKLDDAHDIALLARVGRPILAATRSGRVLEWADVGPPREIVLPPLGAAPPSSPRPLAKLPRWCSVETEVVAPQTIGPLAGSEHTCESLRLAPDSPGCPSSGPWLGLHDEYDIILELGLGDRLARVPLPVVQSYGTEEASNLERALVRSSSPIDAWLRVEEMVGDCIDEETCGLTESGVVHVVVTGLEQGEVLVTKARIDFELLRGPERTKLEGVIDAAMQVDVHGQSVDVWVCGGHASLPLPARSGTSTSESSASESDTSESDTSEPVEPPSADTSEPVEPPSADAAAAAAKQCGAGWTLFKAGDFAAAKVEIDAALAQLEHARDAKGRKSLGACLYNRGRVAEQDGDLAAARGFYERSLAVRPNAAVEARLASLSGG